MVAHDRQTTRLARRDDTPSEHGRPRIGDLDDVQTLVPTVTRHVDVLTVHRHGPGVTIGITASRR